MIKLFLSTLIGLVILVSACVIYFWRDTAYDPSAIDLGLYFLALPLMITTVFFAPVFIIKAMKAQKEKKQQQAEQEALRYEQQQIDALERERPKELPSEQFELHIYSAHSWHSFGENTEIIDSIKAFKSPELDQKLMNSYGLPILSYRIQDLDDLIDSTLDEDDLPVMSMREKRIHSLIRQQFEQHAETLAMVSNHLKQSALFYDSELAYQYKMHPGWTQENFVDDHEEDKTPVQEVPRLNRFTVHILLAENLIHQWNEQSKFELQEALSIQYAILPEQIQIEHHFFSSQTAYSEWTKLLKDAANTANEVNFLISVDSEIDQECLDERFWLNEQYIASEFVSSWCVANTSTVLLDLQPLTTLWLSVNENNFSNYLKNNQLNELAQFQQEHPFVLVLDDANDVKTTKTLQRVFEDTAIDFHHFLYTKQNLGHTQNLSKVFGFMLGMHLQEDMINMIYSTEQDSTYAFFKAYEFDQSETVITQN